MKYQIKNKYIAATLALLGVLGALPNLNAQPAFGVGQRRNGNFQRVDIDMSFGQTYTNLLGLGSGGGLSAQSIADVGVVQALSAAYQTSYNGYSASVLADSGSVVFYQNEVSNYQNQISFYTDNANGGPIVNAASILFLSGLQSASQANVVTWQTTEAADQTSLTAYTTNLAIVDQVIGPSGAVYNAQSAAAAAASVFTNVAAEYSAGPSTASLDNLISTLYTITGGTSANADSATMAAVFAWGTSAMDTSALIDLVSGIDAGLVMLPATDQNSLNSALTYVTNGAWERNFIAVGNAAIISVDSSGVVHIGPNSLDTYHTGATVSGDGGQQELFATDASASAININVDRGTTLLLNGVAAASVDDVSAQVQTEADARSGADVALTNAINTEVTDRTNGDNALSTQIATETTDRTNGDNALSTQISTETTNRINGDNALSTQISTETTNRASADTVLSTQISTETTNRASADVVLQNNINTEATNRANADTALSTQIATETTNRASADTVLSAQISTETTNRASADVVLQNNITAEANTRSAAIVTEATARASADTAEAAARAAADTAEANTRSAAVVTLQTNINTEAASRASADVVLQTNINTEAASRGSADVVLQANITAEANTRSAADATLTAGLNTEIANRTAAVTAEANTRSAADVVLTNSVNTIRRGVAMAAALQTPQIDAGKSNALSVGLAVFDGETGLAAGYAHKVDEGVSINISLASSSGFKETVVRGGVNWSW